MKRILYALAALAFAGFAYLNLNDPDPIQWVAAYGATSLLFACAFFGRADRRIIGWYAVAVSAWMLTMFPGMVDWGRKGYPSITGTMQAHEPHIEVVREFLGLFIAVLALSGLWRSTPPGSRMG
jgi:hypothetical protein